MASKNIKSAEDQPHILPSGQGNRPPRVQDPIPQGESLAAEARDTNTPNKRKKLSESPVMGEKAKDVVFGFFDGSGGKGPERFARYVVVESDTPGKAFDSLNPFVIKAWVKGVSTKLIDNTKPAKNGILINCPDKRTSELLLKRNGTEFMGLKIKVSVHRSLNTSRGAIWCPALAGMTEEEILVNMREENKDIVKIERCFKKPEGVKVPTHTLFIDFDRPKIPEYLYVGLNRVKVELYVRPPMQCFNCQGFGHPSHKCKKQAVCKNCGHPTHEGKCTQPPKCPNCKGEHSPKSKKCPVYLQEYSYRKVMAEKKVSFNEAKQMVESASPLQKMSYAGTLAAGAKQANRPTPAPKPALSKTFRSCAVQFPTEPNKEIPAAILTEAAALGRGLLESMKKKVNTKDASAQFSAATSSASKKGSKTKNKKNPAPSTPKTKTGGTPAPAHQAAGEAVQAANSAQPLPSSSKSSQEEVSAPAHQAAEKDQNDPTSSESEMEETSASAPQAAEGGVEIVSPEEGETTISGSVSNTPFLDFEQENDNDQPFTSPPRKKKWRKKAEKDPIRQSLNRCPFEDPEGNGVSNWG